MNNNKLFLGLILGTLLGTVSTYVVMAKQKNDIIVDYQTRIDELLNGGIPPTFGDFETLPSEPISLTYAEELINNYNCSTSAFKISKTRTLKGWNIERDLISTLFNLYADRGPTGIQLYLGKHEEVDNKNHTLIWMASKDTTYIENGNPVEGMVLLNNKPNTVFQYVKPCPLNCPKNDFTIDCD